MSIFTPYTHVDLVFTFPDEMIAAKAVVEDADESRLRLGVVQVPGQLRVGDVVFLTLVRQGEACYSAPAAVLDIAPGRGIAVEVPDEESSLRIQTREYFRIKATEAVQIFPVGRPGFTTWTRNLSAGGMLIEAVQDLPVGTVCRLVLDFPDGELAMAARVVRGEAGALALVFQMVSDGDRNRLVRALRQLEQRLRRNTQK